MKRILVFNGRDWLHPKAGWVEQYLHEVYARLAMRGHYVVWVAHQHNLVLNRIPPIEIVDRVQVARLGSPLLYGLMSGLFLRRLQETGSRMEPFDVVFECVTGRPLGLHEHTKTPVIPIVFNLHPRVCASDGDPGPAIAPTRTARQSIIDAGVPENCVIHAPVGVDSSFYVPVKRRDERPLLVVVSPGGLSCRGALAEAVRRVRAEGNELEVAVISPRSPRRLPGGVTWHADEGHETRRALFQRAWFGYCDVGAEHEVLAMAASGLAVFCPDTEQGREYVRRDETGILYEAGAGHALAERLLQVIKDEVFRKRLSHNARLDAEAASWEATAGLVLAAAENLPKTQQGEAREHGRQ